MSVSAPPFDLLSRSLSLFGALFAEGLFSVDPSRVYAPLLAETEIAISLDLRPGGERANLPALHALFFRKRYSRECGESCSATISGDNPFTLDSTTGAPVPTHVGERGF